VKPVVVVGAGICGCVTALELAKKGHKVILVEKESTVGGLSRTFDYGDFAFDIGPHRFYSQKKEIWEYIKGVLGSDYAVLPRISEVYFFGKYYSWPLRPDVLFNLPLKITLKSARDLLVLSLRNRKKEVKTFEDYILKNYGPSLYNVFFKDFTEKFLGQDPNEIHFEWAREGMKRTIIDERIGSRNLLDIFKLFFRFRPIKTEFMYPKSGAGIFCQRLAEQFTALGGQIVTGSELTAVKKSRDAIEEVLLKDAWIRPRCVVWTGRIDRISELLGLSCRDLEYLSLILFNIRANKPLNRDYQWCYYGSREIVFSRATITSSFSPALAPPSNAGICVEVTCRTPSRIWDDPETLVERIKKDLTKVGLVSGNGQIGAARIEKIFSAYPIYTLDYPRALKKAKDGLSHFKNLVLAGRTGLFWYNNMDDSIENGLEVARKICQES